MSSSTLLRTTALLAVLTAPALHAASITHVAGWADTGGRSSDSKLQQGYVTQWHQGVGICSRDEGSRCDSPNHAIDNSRDHEMVEITFSADVIIDAFHLGWAYNDSDVTVLAYTGAGAYDLDGKEWNDLLGDGWVAIGDYFDSGTGWTNTGANVASSQWLIGAYNSIFNAPDISTSRYSNGGSDYFKLKQLSWSEPPADVPEPATLALLGLGLLGLGTARRRAA